MTFEESIKKYLSENYTKGSKNWSDYEAAKYECLFRFVTTDEEYDGMIKIITDWLEL